MRRATRPISEIVKTVFADLEKGRNVFREEMEEKWKQTLGPADARHSAPESLRKGILTVRVDSSAWMQEMSMRQRKILKALQSVYGKDKISRLHFKIGEF
ncbi:MAG: DUF721 domain-containing protein [Candidatus Omnitrophica bacterium]|nr:DUF721 domain-containing protein [Candidatus Omnitrophota bacterium]